MKIFSNFDTKLKRKKHQEWVNIYGKDNVMVLSKSKLFRMIRIDIPFLFFCFVALFLLRGSNKILGIDGILYGALPLLAIAIFFLVPKLVKNLMDYHMDFTIVTPKALYRYDQEGAFSRDLISLDIDSIKTLSVKKSGILYSIFNNGDLIFFTEGDNLSGEIYLHYIARPEQIKSRVAKIINKV